MQKLELKIPPAVVVVGMALLMWSAAKIAPQCWISLPARKALGLIAVVAGFSIGYLSVTAFRRAQTTINPLKPETSRALVASGIYSRSRNPIYLGLLFVLLGWALILSNLLAFALLPLFVLYMNRFQIVPEERALEKLFGAEFTGYKAKVRRWI